MKRRELFLPLPCCVIGVLWAICWAMVYRQSSSDRTRVTLDQSLPLAFGGLIIGASVGLFLHRVTVLWPSLKRLLEGIIIPTLTASIMAPLGWITRDERLDWSGEEAITRMGIAGFIVGNVIYLGALIVQYWSRTRLLDELDPPRQSKSPIDLKELDGEESTT
jgi:hypothetical protein